MEHSDLSWSEAHLKPPPPNNQVHPGAIGDDDFPRERHDAAALNRGNRLSEKLQFELSNNLQTHIRIPLQLKKEYKDQMSLPRLQSNTSQWDAIHAIPRNSFPGRYKQLLLALRRSKCRQFLRGP
jgi:hypothetical protein